MRVVIGRKDLFCWGRPVQGPPWGLCCTLSLLLRCRHLARGSNSSVTKAGVPALQRSMHAVQRMLHGWQECTVVYREDVPDHSMLHNVSEMTAHV